MEKWVDLDGPAIATAAWDDYPIPALFPGAARSTFALIDRPDDPAAGGGRRWCRVPVAAGGRQWRLQRLTGAAFRRSFPCGREGDRSGRAFEA